MDGNGIDILPNFVFNGISECAIALNVSCI